MKNRNLFKIYTFLIIAIFPYINVLACECDFADICEEYSKAKKVFIGRLEKVVEDKQAPFYTIKAHFSVTKQYKGNINKSEIVTFKLGDCKWIDFKEGEDYFVYVGNFNVNNYCNRTTLLSKAKQELEYADSLSDTNPIFSIKGQISTKTQITVDDLKKIKLFVKTRKGKKRIEIEKDGSFKIVVKETGRYEVNLVLPFKANVFDNKKLSEENLSVKVSNSVSTTNVRYNLQFKPNECDFRSIYFVPIE